MIFAYSSYIFIIFSTNFSYSLYLSALYKYYGARKLNALCVFIHIYKLLILFQLNHLMNNICQ